MKRSVLTISLAIATASLFPKLAEARERTVADTGTFAPIAETAATLAPFQHVRFCLRYPADCKADSRPAERVDAGPQIMDLLNRVNHSVNMSIAPRSKSYGGNLDDRWTIAPVSGDCNDYAVTKRRELLANGLPASAVRLAVAKTSTGVGHLLLVVSTTKADVVLDNLSEAIRPWQRTDYQWLKIQSTTDPRYWNGIRPAGGDQNVSLLPRKLRITRG